MEGERKMADDAEAPAWTARKLLRAARAATLASSIEGQPFASLVTPACAPDLSVLLLLSDLSEHTRHLRAEPRCAVLVVGQAAENNPQTAPRVTVTGLAEQVDDAGLKARWLAVHPYGALYADFADFHLWRIRPRAALFVGGFARANRLRQAELTPDPARVATLAAAEPDILEHCNTDHAAAMTTLARSVGNFGDGPRMVAADVDGCDLASGDQVVRVAWSAPVADAEGVRNELVGLLRNARAAG
jgi:heme oxygenase (biliverdin-IX-beta and delta-forming)